MIPILNRIIAIVLISIIGGLGILAALTPIIRDISVVWTADSADTTTAIGTVGTLVVAIGIALQGERQRRREALDRAIIATAAVLPRLSHAYDRLVELHAYISTDKYEADAESTIELWLSRMNEVVFWSDQETLPLVVLPHRIAARMITLRIKLEIIQTEYRDQSESGERYRALREHGIGPDVLHEDTAPLTTELFVIRQELRKLTAEVYSPIG